MNECRDIEFRVQPSYSVESAKLISKLKGGKPGDVLTDEELAEICGKRTGPNQPGYNYLQTAIKYCERQGIVWRRLREAGAIKCLESTEIVVSSRDDMQKTHRATKRIARRLGAVKPDELDNSGRVQFAAQMSQTMTIVAFSAEKVTKKLEARKTSEPFDVQRLLENWT
jgi:hypothetical protein